MGVTICWMIPRNQRKIDQAISEIRTRYDAKMMKAPVFTRIWLWFCMRKEVRAAVERIAPSRGCYLKE